MACGVELASPALAGGFLLTGLPERSRRTNFSSIDMCPTQQKSQPRSHRQGPESIQGTDQEMGYDREQRGRHLIKENACWPRCSPRLLRDTLHTAAVPHSRVPSSVRVGTSCPQHATTSPVETLSVPLPGLRGKHLEERSWGGAPSLQVSHPSCIPLPVDHHLTWAWECQPSSWAQTWATQAQSRVLILQPLS